MNPSKHLTDFFSACQNRDVTACRQCLESPALAELTPLQFVLGIATVQMADTVTNQHCSVSGEACYRLFVRHPKLKEAAYRKEFAEQLAWALRSLSNPTVRFFATYVFGVSPQGFTIPETIAACQLKTDKTVYPILAELERLQLPFDSWTKYVYSDALLDKCLTSAGLPKELLTKRMTPTAFAKACQNGTLKRIQKYATENTNLLPSHARSVEQKTWSSLEVLAANGHVDCVSWLLTVFEGRAQFEDVVLNACVCALQAVNDRWNSATQTAEKNAQLLQTGEFLLAHLRSQRGVQRLCEDAVLFERLSRALIIDIVSKEPSRRAVVFQIQDTELRQQLFQVLFRRLHQNFEPEGPSSLGKFYYLPSGYRRETDFGRKDLAAISETLFHQTDDSESYEQLHARLQKQSEPSYADWLAWMVEADIPKDDWQENFVLLEAFKTLDRPMLRIAFETRAQLSRQLKPSKSRTMKL